jgi:pimeloyl-ACP methyl ester carboxylesterase
LRDLGVLERQGSPMNQRANHHPVYGKRILLALLCVVVSAAGAAFVPWPLGGYPSHPQPVGSYEEAVQRAATFDSERAALMNPVCKTQLMTHGHKTEDAIVLVHGTNNCPEQFREFGARFYELGYNVLIAALPQHGLADRLTNAMSDLTAAELASYADETVDIAHGLGERVSMGGLSMGGIVAAWAAQNRSDLYAALLIAPAFGYKEVPTPFTVPAMNGIAVLPESYRWVDAELQMDFPPAWVYPRYSMHAMAQLLRLSFSVQTAAARVRPGATHILVVTNANDTAVNNDLTVQAVAKWRSHSADVQTYVFPASLGLDHDVIDPNRPEQQIDLVYPGIIGLVEQYR